MSGSTQRRRGQPIEVNVPPFGIALVESHHSTTFHMEMGQWPFDKLCWIAVGRGQVEIPDASYAIEQHDLLLLPEGTQHRFRDDPTDPLTLIIVCFSRAKVDSNDTMHQLLEKLANRYASGGPVHVLNKLMRSWFGDSLQRMLREQASKKPLFEVVLWSELAKLLVDMLRDSNDTSTVTQGAEQAITDSLRYIDEHYSKRIKLGELAALYSLSPRRFSELFKQQTGKTLIEYVNAKRIKNAQERLRATSHITYACLATGFRDLGYFYRVFKKYTGQTPGEYVRDQCQETPNVPTL